MEKQKQRPCNFVLYAVIVYREAINTTGVNCRASAYTPNQHQLMNLSMKNNRNCVSSTGRYYIYNIYMMFISIACLLFCVFLFHILWLFIIVLRDVCMPEENQMHVCYVIVVRVPVVGWHCFFFYFGLSCRLHQISWRRVRAKYGLFRMMIQRTCRNLETREWKCD